MAHFRSRGHSAVRRPGHANLLMAGDRIASREDRRRREVGPVLLPARPNGSVRLVDQSPASCALAGVRRPYLGAEARGFQFAFGPRRRHHLGSLLQSAGKVGPRGRPVASSNHMRPSTLSYVHHRCVCGSPRCTGGGASSVTRLPRGFSPSIAPNATSSKPNSMNHRAAARQERPEAISSISAAGSRRPAPSLKARIDDGFEARPIRTRWPAGGREGWSNERPERAHGPRRHPDGNERKRKENACA
ncbi:hypothetical protein BDY21DRAFT_163972 [Lineolata rhizophorae]|uniref:Uncharacterized protein n=1 Tax=Lineolata rhizophorae TaxID=578093 RepID=A0A6A6P947_9PEZI|nr:hypothetical protein BDY21DRAFT_163972 [Lineolata rhizophorae]